MKHGTLYTSNTFKLMNECIKYLYKVPGGTCASCHMPGRPGTSTLTLVLRVVDVLLFYDGSVVACGVFVGDE